MATMNIDILLKKYKLNQKDLSESTGINKNTISRYCNGTFEKVDKTHIDLICKYFKCTPNDIFEIDDSVQVTPAKVLYYDNETDIFSEGEIKVPSNAFKRRATWNYSDPKNPQMPIPTLRNDIDIPESVQKEYDAWVNASVSQPDFQIQDSNGNITSYEIKQSLSRKNRKFHSGREALKIMELLEKEHPDSKSTEEDIVKIENQKSILDLERNIETKIALIITNILTSIDYSLYSEGFRDKVNEYYKIKDFPMSYRFLNIYYVIDMVSTSQLKNKDLFNFLIVLKSIYTEGSLLEFKYDELLPILKMSERFVYETSNILEQKTR